VSAFLLHRAVPEPGGSPPTHPPGGYAAPPAPEAPTPLPVRPADPAPEGALCGRGSLLSALDHLLDAALEILDVELPERHVLEAALAASRDSSWTPIRYLHAWRRQLQDRRQLPAALRHLAGEEAVP
jgi:hypothetical protein